MVGSLLVTEYLTDRTVINMRQKRCKGNPTDGTPPCMFYNEARDQCKVCKCFIKEKSEAKLNYDPLRNGEIVITHCPMGYWDDNDIAELYRIR
jgi:hypothetical protein